MVSKEDKVLTENLYQFKECDLRRILAEFSKKSKIKKRLDNYTKKIRETGSTDHRYDSDRPTVARTEENVISVCELALSQEDQTQTHRSTHQEQTDRQTDGQTDEQDP